MAKAPKVDAGVRVGTVLLDKYRIDEILGRGAYGVVVKCMHLQLDETVAIKMLRREMLGDRDTVERFAREARAAVRLRSEHVARVSDVGVFDDGVPYMVMELLEGQDLGQLIANRQSFAIPQVIELVLQATEALAEAHSLGIVHRDVKPSNLFVTRRPDGTLLLKMLDFGISKAPIGVDLELTQTQSLLGTPAYMSPEQMRSAHAVDARTDIWSLGTVMYELIEGRKPFGARSFSEMVVKVSCDPPAPMVKAPAALQRVVLRCLEKTPEQRYANVAELARVLVPFVSDKKQAAILVERILRLVGRPTPDWNTPRITKLEPDLLRLPTDSDIEPTVPFEPRSRRRVGALAIVTTCVVALTIAVWIMKRGGHNAAQPAADEVPDRGHEVAAPVRTGEPTRGPGGAAESAASFDAAIAIEPTTIEPTALETEPTVPTTADGPTSPSTKSPPNGTKTKRATKRPSPKSTPKKPCDVYQNPFGCPD